MTRLLFISISVLVSSVCLAQQDSLLLGIWQDGKSSHRFYHHAEERVNWITDTGERFSVDADRTTYFTYENGLIRLSTAEKTLGRFQWVKHEEAIDDYVLRSIRPSRPDARYKDILWVRTSVEELLPLLLIEDIDAYVAGVVESESGKEEFLEYYKVQAVISRTYAMGHLRRHEDEGFMLCDQVHCQVYHGYARFNPDIIQASDATKEQVLVDSDMNLITASYHSNCGGYTVNSEDVWSKALPYLRSRKDTFCLQSPHSIWYASIPKSEWGAFLSSRTEDSESVTDERMRGFQRDARQARMSLSEEAHILTKDIRARWRLKSSYFHLEDQGDNWRLAGRGFGHGVGLCQEGAMGMVCHGFDYQDLSFYYKDVHLIHLSVLDFFRDY